MIRAVVFDLDGTIVSHNIEYKALRADVRGFLIKQGVPASVLSLNESVFQMLDKTEIFLKNSGRQRKVFEEMRNEVLKIIDEYEWKAARTAGLCPGVEAVLKTLKDMGIKVGLCTVSGERTVSFLLKKFKIDAFFDAVVPREHAGRVKPHGEHLKTVLEMLKAAPEETLIVGDSTADMLCAREVKAIAVGLPTGMFTKDELISAGANYIITSIADVPTLIERLNKTL